MLPQNQIQISSIQGNKLSIKERVFCSRRFLFNLNLNCHLLATQLTATSNEQMIIIKLPTFLREKNSVFVHGIVQTSCFFLEGKSSRLL